jgi:hypothetical protein
MDIIPTTARRHYDDEANTLADWFFFYILNVRFKLFYFYLFSLKFFFLLLHRNKNINNKSYYLSNLINFIWSNWFMIFNDLFLKKKWKNFIILKWIKKILLWIKNV